MNKRRHYEGLLQTLMKISARKPLQGEERAISEIYPTYRAGFRDALIVMELIESSTNELSDEQFDIIIERLQELTGEIPPTPEES